MRINYQNYINPQLIRRNWKNLNTNWLFSLDKKDWKKINIPFCPESLMSGLQIKGEINKCFYKTTFKTKDNLKTIIHFGAVDYKCRLYINNKFVGSHTGGYTSFEFDISNYVISGDNALFLEVIDDDRYVAFGKQTYKDHTFGCFYTRTTGIWQNVWVEFTPEYLIKNFRIDTNQEKKEIKLSIDNCEQKEAKIYISFKGKKVGEYHGVFNKEAIIKLSTIHKWSIHRPDLYDIEINIGKDKVFSYFGIRNVHYVGSSFYINDEKTYQKLVLDQGFNPFGIYSSPNITFMKNDIKIAQRLGFNGARLHQKVFEPRFLYFCDAMGYIVWGEFPSWGVDFSNTRYLECFLAQWKECIERDYNHPSIVTWCPLNEVWTDFRDCTLIPQEKFITSVYKFTKSIDFTRPVIDTSGGYHSVETDVFDFHYYGSNEEVQNCLTTISKKKEIVIPALYHPEFKRKYKSGEPLNYSEFGGIAFGGEKFLSPEEGPRTMDKLNSNWGYGKDAKSNASFIERYRDLIKSISVCKEISGFCYTQLYDVEQEHNGFYYYDRTPKLSKQEVKIIKSINNF